MKEEKNKTRKERRRARDGMREVTIFIDFLIEGKQNILL